jgi:hypothetical protein
MLKMEKDRFDTVNFDTCPELILFDYMESLNAELCTYILEKEEKGEKISHKDPFIINSNKKNIELCKHLTRFGITKPTEMKGEREIFTKEAIAWFSKWSTRLRCNLPHYIIYEYYEDLEEWYKDNNYDLSRWQPKT